MYTVGNRKSYDKALERWAPRKVGRCLLHGKLYPGGIVFETIVDAREYLRRTGRDHIWSVYKLKGKFYEDSYYYSGDITKRLRCDRAILHRV